MILPVLAPQLLAALGRRDEKIELLRDIEFPDTGDTRFVQLPVDIPLIEQKMVEKNTKFVVIDT